MKTQVQFLMLLGALAFTPSCASTHPGKIGRVMSGDDLGLKVSAHTPNDGDDEKGTHQLIEITFENPGNSWVKVDSTEVIIAPSEQSRIGIVVGDDLTTWAKAAEEKAALEAQNQGTVLGVITAVGAVAAIAGGSSSSKTMKTVGAVGAVAAGGALAYTAVNALSSSARAGEAANWVPADHLYSPFSVPGDLFVRKWLLLTKPRGVLVNQLVIRMKTIEGKIADYELPMKFVRAK